MRRHHQAEVEGQERQAALAAWKLARDPLRAIECRLTSLSVARERARHLSPGDRVRLDEIAAELAREVVASGPVRAGGVVYSCGADGRLRCSLPMDDPYFRESET